MTVANKEAEKLAEIIDQLRNEDTRWDAIVKLRDMDFSNSISVLTPYLKDRDWVVRWIIAEKCGEWGDDTVAQDLIRLLQDRDFHVRQNASKAIVRLGVSAIPSLVADLLSMDNEMRRQVSKILIKMGDRAIPYLEDLFDEQNWLVSNRILDVIWRINSSAAEDALIRAVARPVCQKNAIALLAEMKSARAVRTFIRHFETPNIRQVILTAVRKIGLEKAGPILVKAVLDSDPLLRDHSEILIQRLGDEMIPHIKVGIVATASTEARLLQLLQKISPNRFLTNLISILTQSPHLKPTMLTEIGAGPFAQLVSELSQHPNIWDKLKHQSFL